MSLGLKVHILRGKNESDNKMHISNLYTDDFGGSGVKGVKYTCSIRKIIETPMPSMIFFFFAGKWIGGVSVLSCL